MSTARRGNWSVVVTFALQHGAIRMPTAPETHLTADTLAVSGESRPDDAPGRTAKHGDFGDYEVAGRTVTINRPRAELYKYWRDFQNLAAFMENIERVVPTGPDRAVWTIKAPAG